MLQALLWVLLPLVSWLRLPKTPLPSLPASRETETEPMRRVRKVIMNPGQTLESLDLWPYDEVWFHDGFILLGTVNSFGVFVSHLENLN